MVWNATVSEILGNAGMPPKVTGVKLVDARTGQPTVRSADGVFVAIGHQPATELFRGQLDMKPSGYLKVTPGTSLTNVPGGSPQATSPTSITARPSRRRAWAACGARRRNASSQPRRPPAPPRDGAGFPIGSRFFQPRERGLKGPRS
nr:hypothetical protein [Chenggangzhangella methanolivorans]